MIAEVIERIGKIGEDVLGRTDGRRRTGKESGTKLREFLFVLRIANTARHVELAGQMPGQIAERRMLLVERRRGIRKKIIRCRLAGQVAQNYVRPTSIRLMRVETADQPFQYPGPSRSEPHLLHKFLRAGVTCDADCTIGAAEESQ